MKLSVIIPCYNERATVEEIMKRVMAAPCRGLEKEIVAVDDGSTDGSGEVLEAFAKTTPGMRLFRHEKNRGKGAAIRTAQPHTTGEVAVIQDADLEYNPECYADLVTPIMEGRADMVVGSRFVGGKPRRALFFWHDLANRALTFLSNLTTNLNLTDIECGYKAFKGDVFRSMRLRSERFGIEPEIVARAAKMRLRVYEVPIDYHGRDYSAGKKIGWMDGAAAVFHILRFWVG